MLKFLEIKRGFLMSITSFLYLQEKEDAQGNKVIFDRLARLYLTYYEIEWSSPANEVGNTQRTKLFLTIKITIYTTSLSTTMNFSEEGVSLYMSNGEEHRYNHVIVTCSLGYLKKNHKSFFCPPLSSRKADAIALLAWVSGKGPGLISELSDQKLIEGLTHHLRGAFGDQTIPLPIRIFRLDFEQLHSTVVNFSRSLQKHKITNLRPILCFAGEHTHATMYQTTIGAYESGEREAYRIIDYLTLSLCIQSPPTMLNEVECMAHPTGIDQRRELYPLFQPHTSH
uniref:Amino_oxidase domain-containing protein n=1 Tax=Angiostrongylus cantonensis TaxID=6313 RepID=A0A0K0CW87_ANGCA